MGDIKGDLDLATTALFVGQAEFRAGAAAAVALATLSSS